MKQDPILRFATQETAALWQEQTGATGWPHHTTRGWIVVTPHAAGMVAYIATPPGADLAGVVLPEW
jgi:hypothetical protein